LSSIYKIFLFTPYELSFSSTEYLNTLPFYELQYGKQSYENAALMNIKCRENGITIRSTIDLIIAEIAIENNLYILHDDSDFTYMAKVIKELKIY
jgi:predicted nucleic acid-binding protein